ncbi:hypothetical protein TanjilG_20704 [Lupinus angustifolius]|uniref:B-like cyclin n=1 Tax=Lupinus angustifolius TaxID=3871 RepID=A0A4P1QRJ5_LUPAN|nr:PREDICTED: cyclin-D4-2-like [Lupinus angustifolius]OIV93042.1 hypothetical protein TanjilG_20704 [Lupinus angustifolius]
MADDSLDPATSSLLCCEDNSTCFDDDDLEFNDVVGSRILPFWAHTNLNSFNQCPSFVLQSEETVRVMIEREREHLPRDDYLNRLRSGDLDMSVRREAIDWICKGHAYYGFGYLTFCLAVNYLDRFLSAYELPRGKSWTGQLLAVACLSIAGKMDEIKVPQSIDLQVGEPNFFFDGKTIQRMELLVLCTLRWKMHALTPCSFIDYFLSKITYEKQPTKPFISTSIQLIVSIIRGIDFLEFRPSEIAAAVSIYVTREAQAKDIDKAIVGFSIVEEERVLKCVELIRDLSFNVSANLGSSNNYAPCVPQSPVRVLDTRCLSFKSDELTLGSCPNTSLNIPDTKMEKSDRPSYNGAFSSL